MPGLAVGASDTPTPGRCQAAPAASPAPGRCRHRCCPVSPAPSRRSCWFHARLRHRSRPRPPGGGLGRARAPQPPWKGHWGWGRSQRIRSCWLLSDAGKREKVTGSGGRGSCSHQVKCPVGIFLRVSLEEPAGGAVNRGSSALVSPGLPPAVNREGG